MHWAATAEMHCEGLVCLIEFSADFFYTRAPTGAVLNYCNNRCQGQHQDQQVWLGSDNHTVEFCV